MEGDYYTEMAGSGSRFHFDSAHIFGELPEWEQDVRLREAALACVAVERRAATDVLRDRYRPNPGALDEVSEEALRRLLGVHATVSDINEAPEISNCISFNASKVRDTVWHDDVALARRRLDRLVSRKLLSLFERPRDLAVRNSGHFWYPPGGFMGWHTNARSPGWRLYVSFSEEPGRSFFRYCDPTTGEIVTSLDRAWMFRLFRIVRDRPFWHAIHSDTNRFSFGFRVSRRPSLLERIRRKLAS